jgi:DNA-binding MarR family transcriptional regulator
MRELARSLNIDASNLTGLVDRLEQRGLVRRFADPKDRRVRQLALTQQGVQLRQTLNARLTNNPPLLAGLDTEQRRQLQALLTQAAATTFPDLRPGSVAQL